MKYAVIFLGFLLQAIAAMPQQRQNDCGTPVRFPLKVPDAALAQQRAQQLSPLISLPYPVKVFVVIFANSDGSNVAATEADVLRQFANMRDFYAPRNICFILTGIDQVNNTDLNNLDTDTEEGELSPFVRANSLTVFVHASLFSGADGSWNGFAYDIPNNYLSIVSGALSSTTNLSTLAHEMGHCLGLYHTFQSRRDADNNIIRENRDRSGACKNCDTEGDLLCDTDADRNNDDTNISATTCNYIGPTVFDACGDALLMEPTNIMTYGLRSCRDNFTANQGSRAQSFILTTAYLLNSVAEDDLQVIATATFSTGERIYAARNTVVVNNGVQTLNYTGSSQTYISSRAVTVRPNTTFAPGTGMVHIRPGTLCN